MNLKRFFALALAGTLSLSLLAGCGDKKIGGADASTDITASTDAADSDLVYVTGKGKLTIGYTLYEPMNYMGDDGKLTGFDTEFAEAVCEKLGVTPEFVEINWDTKLVELKAKSIDCVWNGMTITDDLKQNLAITAPYVKNKQVIVIQSANQAKFPDAASLAAANIVAEAGSAGEAAVQADASLSTANLTTVTKQTDALLEVKSGTSDAAVFDWTLAKNMIGEGTDFSDLMMIENVSLSEENYGVGFRADSDLCEKVNEIMADLIADGTLPALAEKYGLSLADA